MLSRINPTLLVLVWLAASHTSVLQCMVQHDVRVRMAMISFWHVALSG
jgi:hypothetical protein